MHVILGIPFGGAEDYVRSLAGGACVYSPRMG